MTKNEIIKIVRTATDAVAKKVSEAVVKEFTTTGKPTNFLEKKAIKQSTESLTHARNEDTNLTSNSCEEIYSSERIAQNSVRNILASSRLRIENYLEPSMQRTVDTANSAIVKMLQERQVLKEDTGNPLLISSKIEFTGTTDSHSEMKKDLGQIPEDEQEQKRILAKAAESFKNHKYAKCEEIAEIYGISVKEVIERLDNNVKEMLPRDKIFVVTNVPTEEVLLAILKDGEIKAARQTGTTNGSFGKIEREIEEQQTAQFILSGKENVDPAKDDIYGHVTNQADGRAASRLVNMRIREQYGSISLIYKPIVIDDTKVTLDDEANHAGYINPKVGKKSLIYVPDGEPFKTMQPVPLNNPNSNAYPWDEYTKPDILFKIKKLEHWHKVVEARISRENQPLTIEALARIVFHRPFNGLGQDEAAKTYYKQLFRKLKEGYGKYGITIDAADNITKEKAFGDL